MIQTYLFRSSPRVVVHHCLVPILVHVYHHLVESFAEWWDSEEGEQIYRDRIFSNFQYAQTPCQACLVDNNTLYTSQKRHVNLIYGAKSVSMWKRRRGFAVYASLDPYGHVEGGRPWEAIIEQCNLAHCQFVVCVEVDFYRTASCPRSRPWNHKQGWVDRYRSQRHE